MRVLAKAMIVIFLMSAFAIGISLQDQDMDIINEALNNASSIAENITFPTDSPNPYVNGMLNVFEHFVKLALATGMEVMRIGILFGHDNPQYFEAEFILTFMQLFIWLIAISVMFVPMMYLLAFFVVLGIWIKNKFFSANKSYGPPRG